MLTWMLRDETVQCAVAEVALQLCFGQEGGVEGLGGLVWAVVGEGGSESLGKSLQSSCLPTCNTEGSGARWSRLLHVLIVEGEQLPPLLHVLVPGSIGY